jgi:hypothetical protein
MRLPRFTIRSILLAVTLCALTLWALMLPGFRAERLVQLIRNGETDSALGMLTDLPDDALQYENVVKHVTSRFNSIKEIKDLRQIELQSPTALQLLTFRRSVLVGQGWGGGNCELIVTPTSVRAGRNWFHVL